MVMNKCFQSRSDEHGYKKSVSTSYRSNSYFKHQFGEHQRNWKKVRTSFQVRSFVPNSRLLTFAFLLRGTLLRTTSFSLLVDEEMK